MDKEDQDSDCFCLVIVDFSRKKFFYLDPKFHASEYHQRAHDVCELLNRFLDHNLEEAVHGEGAHDWTIAMSVDGGMHFPMILIQVCTYLFLRIFLYSKVQYFSITMMLFE